MGSGGIEWVSQRGTQNIQAYTYQSTPHIVSAFDEHPRCLYVYHGLCTSSFKSDLLPLSGRGKCMALRNPHVRSNVKVKEYL